METSFRGVPASVNLMFIFGRRQQAFAEIVINLA
jgi:hypothetical protein